MSGALINHTPFQADLFPHTQADGRRCVVVVVKGTWLLGAAPTSKPSLAPYDRQVPVYRAPPLESLSDLVQSMGLSPVQSEIIQALPPGPWAQHETDLCPPKPRFDLIVNAWANHPQQQAFNRVEAAVDHVNGQQHVQRLIHLHAHAPRRWMKRLGGLGDPVAEYLEPVRRVPLFRSFAFGGQALRADGNTAPFQENPSGMGYHLQREQANGAPLPWLESTNQPMRHWKDTPSPVALGTVPIHHLPRRALQGTYDTHWEQQRLPRPPVDSGPRQHNAAPEPLQLKATPHPGEALVLHHMGDHAQLHFSWPTIALSACPETSGGTRLPAHELIWDTLVIDTTQLTAALIWRCELPLPALEKPGLVSLFAQARPPHLAANSVAQA
jgi:hypothetical protein